MDFKTRMTYVNDVYQLESQKYEKQLMGYEDDLRFHSNINCPCIDCNLFTNYISKDVFIASINNINEYTIELNNYYETLANNNYYIIKKYNVCNNKKINSSSCLNNYELVALLRNNSVIFNVKLVIKDLMCFDCYGDNKITFCEHNMLEEYIKIKNYQVFIIHNPSKKIFKSIFRFWKSYLYDIKSYSNNKELLNKILKISAKYKDYDNVVSYVIKYFVNSPNDINIDIYNLIISYFLFCNKFTRDIFGIIMYYL
jgi:hypothetical protein